MKVLLSVITLLFYSQVSFAQTADEIIEKYIESRGGKEKLNAIQTICFEGSKEVFGISRSIKINIEQGKFYREDYDMFGEHGFSIITTTEGWKYSSINPKKMNKISDTALAAAQYKYDIEGSLVDYAAKGHKVALIGTDTINAQECFKIKFTSNIGTEILYWFDKKSFYKVQSSIKETTRVYTAKDVYTNVLVEDIIQYKNYRFVDGVLFPFIQTIEIYRIDNGVKLGNVNTYYNNIQPNKPIDPRLYRLK